MPVIDFCLTRTLVCDEDTNYQSLRLTWASKTSCNQRKGKMFVSQHSHGLVALSGVFKKLSCLYFYSFVETNFVLSIFSDSPFRPTTPCPLNQWQCLYILDKLPVCSVPSPLLVDSKLFW